MTWREGEILILFLVILKGRMLFEEQFCVVEYSSLLTFGQLGGCLVIVMKTFNKAL